MDKTNEKTPIVEAEPPLLTPEQIANYMNVSTHTVVRWINNGDLPGFKVGRQYRIRPADFEKFMTVSASPSPAPDDSE